MSILRCLSLVLLLLATPLAVEAAPRVLSGKPKLLHPIVLVHGATVHGSRLEIGPLDFGPYFKGIPEFYGGTGTPVYVAQLSTDGSIGERAAVLKNYLETELKGQMVNIVAHSLGGLDARYATSVLGARQIASITTIGTPHRGTPLASWAVKQMKRGGLWYWFFRLLGYDMKQRRFLQELTPEFMASTFNPKVRDLMDVKYFSVSTSASFKHGSMSYLLWFPARWLEGQSHPLAANGHDGLVPLDSQPWGKEITRQTMDHLGQINHHSLRVEHQDAQAYITYTLIYEALLSHGL